MSSPPRRMTRARAKKEGYEPDWRINPNWKTPKKPKAKTTRLVLQDDVNVDKSVSHQSTTATGAQRMPSPVKIRIAAKLPLQPQIETLTLSTATESELALSAA